MPQKRPLLKIKPGQPSRPAAPAPKPGLERRPAPRQDFQPDLPQDSLALALLGAAQAVSLVQAGTALPQALASIAQRASVSPQARGAAQDIAYRAMRKFGLAEALIAQLTTKAVQPPLLYALLCCAFGLLAGTEEERNGQPYEEFTLVDQAVRAADAHPDLAHAKGMVNAVLRRFLRERTPLMQAVLQQPVASWNYPQWWIDAMRSAYPEQWQAILAAGNALPPLTLRVNRRRTTVASYLARLAEQGIAARQLGPDAVMLEKPTPVHLIPGFGEGIVSVQDAAAQLAAPLLDVQDGMRVLDACAAPGGKTGHLLEMADLDLLALDADGKRLPRIAENLERLGLSARLATGDAQVKDWWDGRAFDRILADVPCTASGIVRRHPDIRWLRRKTDTQQLSQLAARILDNLWQMLRPGGKLLFVTCSVWPQESEAQAAAFAVRHGAIRLAGPSQLLPTSNIDKNHDGLFYALFEKPA